MKPVAVLGMSVLLVLGGAAAASAQLTAASEGPVVYGHHHLLVTDAEIEALGLAIAFFTDPWGTYIELTEGLDEY